MPIKVLGPDSMLLSVRKLWEMFSIKQKFNRMAAFSCSEHFETRPISSFKNAKLDILFHVSVKLHRSLVCVSLVTFMLY